MKLEELHKEIVRARAIKVKNVLNIYFNTSLEG
jgi:hypothetical protein